jgi:hypothetical protein
MEKIQGNPARGIAEPNLGDGSENLLFNKVYKSNLHNRPSGFIKGFKNSARAQARKSNRVPGAPRLGRVQLAVLACVGLSGRKGNEYGNEYGFMIADVVKCLRKYPWLLPGRRYLSSRDYVANRRVHDALKRLERDGVVRRVGHGQYAVEPRWLPFVASLPHTLPHAKGHARQGNAPGRGAGDVGVVDVDRRKILRGHVRGVGDVVSLRRVLVALEYSVPRLRRAVDMVLLKSGFSKRFLRRDGSVVRGFVERGFRLGVFFVGAHGRPGSGGREFSPLVNIKKLDGLYFNEAGPDALIPPGFQEEMLSILGTDHIELKLYVNDNYGVEEYIKRTLEGGDVDAPDVVILN